MNYLIFGGEGFIGRHLTDYLINTEKVCSSKIFSYDIRRVASNSNYTFLDVRKEINIDLPDISNSVIFNLAAVHTTPGHPDHEYFETNILGSENICAFAEKFNITKIAFTSSIAPYGASEENKTEYTLPMPNSPYGISKLVAEHIHKTWQAKASKTRSLLIVRPGVVFGRGEGGNFTRLYNAMKKGVFFYPGRNDTIKGCVYVKDVARILNEVGTKDLGGDVTTLNLTYYPAPTIREICETISKVTEVPKPKVLIPSWILKPAAASIYTLGTFVGKKFNGIHPARINKLMISTNINGKKLANSTIAIKYTLEEAIKDWYRDCEFKGLS